MWLVREGEKYTDVYIQDAQNERNAFTIPHKKREPGNNLGNFNINLQSYK